MSIIMSGTTASVVKYGSTTLDKVIYNSTTVYTAVSIVTWSSGSIDNIKNMLAAAKAGTINIADYWSIGQGRTVSYTSTIGTSSSEWVLTDFNNNTSGGTAYTAWIHTRDLLVNSLYMNTTDTNVGGWNNSYCRTTWMPNIYNAIPSDFRGLFINGKHKASAGNQSGINKTDTYYLTLMSEKEVFGAKTYATDNEANVCRHLAYFQTASNRYKTGNNGSYSSRWWLRSPYATYSGGFCCVSAGGRAFGYDASLSLGLAPAAVI